MTEDVQVLSFQCTSQTTPVKEPLLADQNLTLAVTIPTCIFSPAFNRLSEGNGSMKYAHYMRICTMLFRLLDDYNLSKMKNEVNGIPKLAIYMEYMVNPCIPIVDKDNFTCPLFSCRYIRFFFCINDMDFKINDALHEFLKTGKPAKTPPQSKTFSEQNFAHYKAVQNLKEWVDCCETYAGISRPISNAYNQYIDTAGKLDLGSLFALETLFNIEDNTSVFHESQSNYKDDGFSFGLPHMVFRIPDYMWDPMSMLAVTLPRTIKWSISTSSQNEEISRILLSPERLRKYYDSSYTKRNDLQDLKSLYEVRKNDGESQSLQTETIEALQNLWCDGACVSRPIKKMSKWSRERSTWSTSPPINFDPKLSYFGNMIAEDMESLERDFFLQTSHTIFIRLAVAALNAYWYARKLHLNVSMLGGGASGKSHLLDLIREIFIPDTVTKVSHATEKASTVDEDNNDHITLYHEAPPQFLGQGSKNADQQTGSHILKDMLTSCEVNSSSIAVDDFGRRRATACSSECSGVILLATNECATNVPQPVRSRSMMIDVNQARRAVFDLQTMNDESNRARSDPVRVRAKNISVERWRFRQVMVNMVEKMMFIGLLNDVDMTPGYEVIDRCITQLKTDGSMMESDDSVRSIGFVKMFARTITIIHACDKYARDPQSKGHDKPIEFIHLINIEPYLVCTEEIALFTLTILCDQLINSNKLYFIALILSRCKTDAEIIINETDYECNCMEFRDRRALYHTLNVTQKNTFFRTKMSPENMRVAMSKLTTETYLNHPILIHDEAGSRIRINRLYIDKFFTQLSEGWQCSVLPHELVVTAYEKAYEHKFSSHNQIFTLGSIPDLDYPFVLNTFTAMRNSERTLERVNKDIGACFFTTDQQPTSRIEVTCHLEIDALRKRGIHEGTEILYNYERQKESNDTYPDSIMSRYSKMYKDVSPPPPKRIRHIRCHTLN